MFKGDSMAKQSTSEYYKSLKIKDPERYKRTRLEPQAKINRKPTEKKRRAKLLAENIARGTNGNGDHKDVSHKRKGGTVLQAEGENRKHNGSGKRSRYSA